MEGPARMARQPGQHLGVFVGGIVVENDVDRPVGRDLALDGIEKADEFEMPVALAIARPVQWVAWCGGAVQVNATTRAVVSAAIGALPGLRVLSCNRPSTPLSAKRCCHRHTVGLLTPILCATCCAECRSAEASTMRARSTCLRGRLRSATIAANCSRSAALTTTHTV